MTTTAYIALGSNLGDSDKNLRLATASLQQLSVQPIRTSSIWRTKPEGFEESVPDFCNALVAIEVSISATELLLKLKAIEESFGRARIEERSENKRYSSRTLDLDIIDFGGQVSSQIGLELPHPRAHIRRFVLLPLQELNVDFRFSNLDMGIDKLIENAPSNPMRKSIPLIPLA